MNSLAAPLTLSPLKPHPVNVLAFDISLKPAHTSPLLSESHKQMIACVHSFSCCQACDLKTNKKKVLLHPKLNSKPKYMHLKIAASVSVTHCCHTLAVIFMFTVSLFQEIHPPAQKQVTLTLD